MGEIFTTAKKNLPVQSRGVVGAAGRKPLHGGRGRRIGGRHGLLGLLLALVIRLLRGALLASFPCNKTPGQRNVGDGRCRRNVAPLISPGLRGDRKSLDGTVLNPSWVPSRPCLGLTENPERRQL